MSDRALRCSQQPALSDRCTYCQECSGHTCETTHLCCEDSIYAGELQGDLCHRLRREAHHATRRQLVIAAPVGVPEAGREAGVLFRALQRRLIIPIRPLPACRARSLAAQYCCSTATPGGSPLHTLICVTSKSCLDLGGPFVSIVMLLRPVQAPVYWWHFQGARGRCLSVCWLGAHRPAASSSSSAVCTMACTAFCKHCRAARPGFTSTTVGHGASSLYRVWRDQNVIYPAA